jgi:hypothetical protein
VPCTPRAPCSDDPPEGQWDTDPEELAAFFEVGRAPTPGPSEPRAQPKVSRIRGNAKKTTPLCLSPKMGCAVSCCNPLLGRETRDLRSVVPSTNTALPVLLILYLITQTDRSPWVRPDLWAGPELNYLADLGEEVPKRQGTGPIRDKGKKREGKRPYT